MLQISGLYCGLSAYACKAEAPPADTPDAAETRMMTLFNERMHNDRVREDAAGQRHKNNLIKFFLGGNRK